MADIHSRPAEAERVPHRVQEDDESFAPGFAALVPRPDRAEGDRDFLRVGDRLHPEIKVLLLWDRAVRPRGDTVVVHTLESPGETGLGDFRRSHRDPLRMQGIRLVGSGKHHLLFQQCSVELCEVDSIRTVEGDGDAIRGDVVHGARLVRPDTWRGGGGDRRNRLPRGGRRFRCALPSVGGRAGREDAQAGTGGVGRPLNRGKVPVDDLCESVVHGTHSFPGVGELRVRVAHQNAGPFPLRVCPIVGDVKQFAQNTSSSCMSGVAYPCAATASAVIVEEAPSPSEPAVTLPP